MNNETSFPLKRTGIIVLIIGVFGFLLYLYFVGLAEVVDEIRQADPFYYSLAFAAMIMSVAFYSLTWHRLLRILSVRSSFLKTFQFIWVGSFVDLLVPAESISGDISRAYLMSKESGDNAGKVVASIIGHRILAMTITLAGLVISSLYFLLKYPSSLLVIEFVSVIASGTLMSVILILYFSKRRQATDRIVNWIIGVLVRFSRGRWKLERLKASAEKLLKAFHEGIDNLGVRPSRLALPVSFAIIAWLFDLLIAVFVFHALNASIPFSAIVIVYSISVGIQTAPIGIPGEVGVLDIIMATLYTLLGVPIVVSGGATILIRFLTLWVRLLIGGLNAQWIGIKGIKPSNTTSELGSN